MKKILYLSTEDWFFCSHFIERAIAAREAGYDVVVVTRNSGYEDQIRKAGIRLIPVNIHRRGVNLFKEFATILTITRIYIKERPDILHHVALKPIFYGSFAARLIGLKNVINAPVGMGFVFSSGSLLAKCLRPLVKFALYLFLNPIGSRVVFENRDDLSDALQNELVRIADATLIRGAGINLSSYTLSDEVAGPVTVVLVARMLWDKGVGEYVAAARLLKEKKIQARFLLVGAPDTGNPASIPIEQLNEWATQGIVEWLGHRQDIPEILLSSHIACLPSYREGLPKSLLEALAAAKPVVTTDVPGCREVVEDGVNGFLVPAKAVLPLALALERLIMDPQLRHTFGRNGREKAKNEFSSDRVIASTLALYQQYNHD